MASKNDYYVYVYSHPDTRQPFYVGKGRGSRAIKHLDFEEAENERYGIRCKQIEDKAACADILVDKIANGVIVVEG